MDYGTAIPNGILKFRARAQFFFCKRINWSFEPEPGQAKSQIKIFFRGSNECLARLICVRMVPFRFFFISVVGGIMQRGDMTLGRDDS